MLLNSENCYKIYNIYIAIINNDVVAVVRLVYFQAELNQSGSTLGYRAMHLKLRRIYGLRVPRDFVRQLLLVLDPAGVRLRLKNRMVRRRYYLKVTDVVGNMCMILAILLYTFSRDQVTVGT